MCGQAGFPAPWAFALHQRLGASTQSFTFTLPIGWEHLGSRLIKGCNCEDQDARRTQFEASSE